MKKFYYLMLSFTLCFFFLNLIGCQQPQPVKIVKSELNLIQQLDESAIRAFVSYEDMMHGRVNDFYSEDSVVTEAIQLFFENFDYRILSYSTTDTTATVNVEITNIDTKALAKDLCLRLSTQSMIPEDVVSLTGTNSYFLLLKSILEEQKYELISTPAHFNLIRTNDSWTIQSTDTLENELVSGFISHLQDPYLVSPTEITTEIFETFRQQRPEDWVNYFGMKDIFSTYSSLYQETDLALADQISKYFSYEIKEVTVKGNCASAVVRITSLNLEHVLDLYMEKLLEYASTTDAVKATDTELADKTASLLTECLNSNTKTYTKSVTIPFTNNGSIWEVQFDSDVTNALLGNMSTAVEKFQKQSQAHEND